MDWQGFLADNNIHFVTSGPNTKRGEVSVRCPWCGQDDPSEHLGINLSNDFWGCHRNPAHRGKSKTYLIRGLLHCSKAQAELTLRQYEQADPDTLEQALAALHGTPEAPKARPEALTLPPEFKPLTGKFRRYLAWRGFTDPTSVGSLYNLKCATTGRWKDRLIFPVYQSGKLVAWTGRALGNPVNAPRYLSTSNAIKSAIYNEDELVRGGETLFVTEGPIDALKVDYYGRNLNSRATCVFGTSITIDQISILKHVAKRFRRVVLLFDPEAVETAFDMSEWLPHALVGQLPAGAEDPGALRADEVKNLCVRYRV
jgi:hypothetical protein